MVTYLRKLKLVWTYTVQGSHDFAERSASAVTSKALDWWWTMLCGSYLWSIGKTVTSRSCMSFCFTAIADICWKLHPTMSQWLPYNELNFPHMGMDSSLIAGLPLRLGMIGGAAWEKLLAPHQRDVMLWLNCCCLCRITVCGWLQLMWWCPYYWLGSVSRATVAMMLTLGKM